MTAVAAMHVLPVALSGATSMQNQPRSSSRHELTGQWHVSVMLPSQPFAHHIATVKKVPHS